MRLYVISCLLLAAIVAAKDYNGYEVFRTSPQTREQHEFLANLEVMDSELDFWSEAIFTRTTDIMAPPHKVEHLKNMLRNEAIPFTTMIKDVGQLVAAEQARLAKRKAETQAMTWEDYNPVETIYQWMENLALVYPDLVTLINFGQSYEGQDMKMIKVSTGGSGKPAFYMDAGIHAREWIAPATLTYIMNEIITKRNQYWDIVDNADFYFVPNFNPDGYRHTFAEDGERLWRKTRSDNGSPIGCLGVDGNRNMDYAWNTCPGCSSGDPCSQTYRGPNPFSEPETAAMRDFLAANTDVNWHCYISFHSYSQLMLTPWGHQAEYPEDYDDLKLAGDYFAGNLTAVHGTPYVVGSSHEVLYPIDGSTLDWAKANHGFKFVYLPELRDTGSYGFLLPPEQIIPTAEETWAGVQALARHILSLQ